MADRRDNESAERTVATPAPDRIDTNEKADDLATVVDPDGSEVVEAIPDEHGRTEAPPQKA